MRLYDRLLLLLVLRMMCWFYPGGAHGAHCGGDADCVPTAYNPVVCWIDVLGVLFLFLVSRANENTIKFGMSWHVCFMMDFMNPTKILGAIRPIGQ